MDDYEKQNWQRIKDYFDTLPEEKRENMFYKRACKIVASKPDPLPPLE